MELEAIKFYYSRKIPSASKSYKTRIIKSAPAEDVYNSTDVPINIEFLNKDFTNLQKKLQEFYGKKYELLPGSKFTGKLHFDIKFGLWV